MKYRIRRSAQFKRDVKRATKRGKDIEQLLSAVQQLAEGRSLPDYYHDHPLKGRYKDKRDCHLDPDWILIYAVVDNELVLYR